MRRSRQGLRPAVSITGASAELAMFAPALPSTTAFLQTAAQLFKHGMFQHSMFESRFPSRVAGTTDLYIVKQYGHSRAAISHTQQ